MHYRVYSLNPVTHRIVHATDLLADDDLAAVRQGRAEHAGSPFEIWCGTRRVHHAEAGAATPERDAG